MSGHLEHAPEFMQLAGIDPDTAKLIMKRLKKGHKEYGDASYELPPPLLFAEIEQEAQDLVGWPFIMWRKMQLILQDNRSAPAKLYAEEVAKAMVLVAADAGVMLEHIRELKTQFT